MNYLTLSHCRIFDGLHPEIQEDVHIVIDGLHIKDITNKLPQNGNVINMDNRIVMPGLIDAHVHMTATRTDVAQLEHTPRTLLSYQSGAIAEGMLQRGFTTVRDVGGADYGLCQAIEQDYIAGPRLFYGGKILSPTGGHGDIYSAEHQTSTSACACCSPSSHFTKLVDGLDAMRIACRNELRRGASHIKLTVSGGVASPRDPIDNIQFSEEEIRAAVWEAEAWNKYVVAHAYTSKAITRALEYGVRSIEHANLIDRVTAKLAREKDAWVVPTMTVYDCWISDENASPLSSESYEKAKYVHEKGREGLTILTEEGVNIGFGTDLLGDMHKEQSREFLIRAEVQTPFDVLKSATSDNARLLNREGELGCITSGALADLIALDGNPLDDLSVLQEQGRYIPLIMKAGKLYKHAF